MGRLGSDSHSRAIRALLDLGEAVDPEPAMVEGDPQPTGVPLIHMHEVLDRWKGQPPHYHNVLEDFFREVLKEYRG